MIKNVIEFLRNTYNTSEFIPLHVPQFIGNERKYVAEAIDSTYVSSIGKYVDNFERGIEAYTRTPRAVAVVNGTAALYTALYLAGVSRGDLVLTQALTFVATCNVIHQLGAEAAFVDVSRETLGMCPSALESYLVKNAELSAEGCYHKKTGQRIKAVVPMHTFGHPVDMDKIVRIASDWRLQIIEDAAESLGSYYKGQHTGTIGDFGAISFNGNKTITCGGGGVLMCRSSDVGTRAKHITSTAKVPHKYEFFHDELGFNYRMPNLNAAVGCAQLEALPCLLEKKRWLASQYKELFKGSAYQFVDEPGYGRSNFWLNAVVCEDVESRDHLLKELDEANIMARPVWKLMHRLPMYKNALRDELSVSSWLEDRVVNLPSTPVV